VLPHHLQLDVDLDQAPSVGSVQLDLWCGRSLLASAPLLLLPSVNSDSDSPDTDPLLEELQQCVEQLGWATSSDDSSSSSGASALLADLGRLLYTVGCVQQLRNPRAAGNSSSSSGPASWGGVVSSLAAQHASDATLLGSALDVAEGLLEYAEGEGFTHTAQLLTGSMAQLQQRLQEVQGSTSTSTQAAAAPATPAKKAAVPIRAEVHSSSKRELKHRRQGSASKLAPGAETAAVAKQQSKPARSPAAQGSGNHQPQRSAQVIQLLTGSVLTEYARYAVLGFGSPHLEGQYKQWTAVRCRTMTITHSLLLTMWVMASTARSISDGWESFLVHLPVHVLCGAPYVATALLAMCKQHRWVGGWWMPSVFM
jgi:hypothetical protein